LLKKLSIILILLSAANVNAQKHVVIKEVLIEAEAENEAINEQKQAGVSKLVASSKNLNNFGHHAAGDVLKRMPRIFVQGPPSFNRNIMMAGLDKQFQSILINGNRPAGGEDYRDLKLDRIPIDMIEKIEVIYNPPAIYGADATIGLVNLVLKDVPDKKLISADLAFDNTSTYSKVNPSATIAYGNKWGKWSVYTSYSLNRFNRNNQINLNDTSISGKSNELLDVWVNGFTGTIVFAPDSTQKWKFQSFFSDYSEKAYFIADVKRRTKGGLSLAADTADDVKHRLLHTHTLEYCKSWKNTIWETTLTFSEHFDSKDRWRWRENSDNLEISFEDEFQRNSEVLFTTDVTHKLKTGNVKHDIKQGVKGSVLDRVYDRMVYTKLDDRLFWDDISDGSYTLFESRLSYFMSDALSYKKIWVLPAIRFDYDAFNFNTQSTDGDKDAWTINPSLHGKYSITKDFSIKADIARQISRPPFNLMVPIDKVKNKKQLIERGNSDLVPSTAINMGFGAEEYFGDNNYFTLRGFYTILRDLIETREVGIDDNYGYRIFQSVNVDSGLVWGIDASLRINLVKQNVNQLVFVGNVSWLGSEVCDPGTQQLRRLNEQPNWISNASLDYLNTKLKLQCSVGLNYVGNRYISATIDEGAIVDKTIYSPFTQVDARIKYFYSAKGSVYVNVVNLFDEYNYSTQGGVQEQEFIGRNIIVGTSYRF
jgi:outer membrane receptor for ferrienterochelin and colicins